jgi:hypothetical protein
VREAAAKSEAAYAGAKSNIDRLSAEIAAAPAKLTGLETAATTAGAEAAKAKEGLTGKAPAATALAEASAKCAEAAAKLPNDAEVKTAAATVKAKADAAAAEVATLQKNANDAQAKADGVGKQIAETKAALEKSKAELAALQPRLPALEAEAKSARAKAADAETALNSARDALSAAWGRSFAANELLPLAPEQLCWSLMQATGQLDPQRAAATAEWDAKNKLSFVGKINPVKQAERSAGIEKLFRQKLLGHEQQFVRSFGGAPGVAQTDFFATPEQALYFENGGVARQWAATLAQRVAALPEPKAMAEELYLSTLTRMPSDGETAEVAAALATHPPEKKAEALTDYAWALVTSVEFRFSH